MASKLPATLVRADHSTVETSAYLAGKEYVMLYFSASWCGPCMRFTPKLNEWFDKHAERLKVAIVLVPGDRSEAESFKYLTHMHWNAAVPFTAAEKDKLPREFKVEGIPTLVLLDMAGNTITKDAVEAVMEDADGARFPWKPRNVWDVLETAGVVTDNAGATTPVSELRKLSKGIGLYFSAHWCPPCRGFTPQLAEWYKARVAAAGGALHGAMDIVFVSSDRDDASFKGYLAEMPWKALPFAARDAKAELSRLFNVSGIPTLVFVDSTGRLVTADGRSKVTSDPDGFPWPPKACDVLSEATDYINDVPVAVLFTDKLTDAAAEVAVTTAFQAVAAEYFAGGAPSDAIRFAVAADGDDALEQVRGFLGAAHTRDKDGDNAVRITIVDISSGKKFLWNDGTPAVPTEADIRAFVASFVAGAATGVGLRT